MLLLCTMTDLYSLFITVSSSLINKTPHSQAGADKFVVPDEGAYLQFPGLEEAQEPFQPSERAVNALQNHSRRPQDHLSLPQSQTSWDSCAGAPRRKSWDAGCCLLTFELFFFREFRRKKPLLRRKGTACCRTLLQCTERERGGSGWVLGTISSLKEW